MNADAIIERLEKLETWWADLGDDQDVLVVRKSDLDAAIADIRGLLAEPTKCSTCDGTGWVPSAFFPGGRGCGKCGGAGTMEARDETV